MSRLLSDLQPWFKVKASAFIWHATQKGYSLVLIRTLTTDAIQKALYAIGRRELTDAEKQLLKNEGLYPNDISKTRTNADSAKKTPHGLGLAFDCIPKKDGKIIWDPSKEVWQDLYSIAEVCGLDALGDSWGEFMPTDLGHFQEPGWKLYREYFSQSNNFIQ